MVAKEIAIMILNIDELYKWADSLGNVEWMMGMDDVIVGNLKKLIDAGISMEDAKEIIESLVNGACSEVYAEMRTQ